MELLMTSLYNLLLNQSTPDIPVSIKHSLLHDITNGLVFLHSRSVIHRDLTASNILIDSSLTAKIADLGMARLLNIQAGKHVATMTKGPGNASYMPPEAKDGLITKYGKPIDTFSMGNLILFTATQERPDPLNPTYFDEQSCTMKARSERERRVNSFHLLEQMYGKDHPFVLLATQCLQDNPRARPTAPEILGCLEKMPVIPYRDWSFSKLEFVQHIVSNEQEQRSAPPGFRLALGKEQQSALPGVRLALSKEKQFQNFQEEAQSEKLEQMERGENTPVLDVHQLDAPPGLLPNQQDVSRDVTVQAIMDLRVKPGQPIQQVQVPFQIFQWAKKFVVQAPNFLSDSEPYRFKVLYRMESGRSIYDLLIDDAANTALKDAEAKIVGWKEASEAILHYALNLLLAPNCPEFKRLKLSRSHYVHQVARKLRGAEEILLSMGFERIAGFPELEYKDDVDNLHVAETAADLVILDRELMRVKGLVSHVCKENHAISLTHILQARAHPTEILEHAIDRAYLLAKSTTSPVVHHPIAGTPVTGYNSAQPHRRIINGKKDNDYVNSDVLDSSLQAVVKTKKKTGYENFSVPSLSPHAFVGEDPDYKNVFVDSSDHMPRTLSLHRSSRSFDKPPVASPRSRYKTFPIPNRCDSTHSHSSYTEPESHSLNTNETSKVEVHDYDDVFEAQQQDPSFIERRPRWSPPSSQLSKPIDPSNSSPSLCYSGAAVDHEHMYSDHDPLNLSNIDEDASMFPEEEDSLISSLESKVVWRPKSCSNTSLLNRQSFHGSLCSFEMVMEAPHENNYSLVPTSGSDYGNISQGRNFRAKTLQSLSTHDILDDTREGLSLSLLKEPPRPRSNAVSSGTPTLPRRKSLECGAVFSTFISQEGASNRPSNGKEAKIKRLNTDSVSESRGQSRLLSINWLRRLKRTLTYKPQK